MPMPWRVVPIAVLCVAVIAITGSTAAVQMSNTSITSVLAPSALYAKPGTPEGAEQVLSVINSVPDGVYQQGPQATQDWLKNRYQQSRVYSPWAACAGGVITAIAANAIAISKLLKVKKAVEGMGGVARAVDKIRGKVKRGKKFQDAVIEVFGEGGAGLGSVAVEIFSLNQVVDNCF